MNRKRGLTLVEVLIALVIFGIVAMIATSGVITGLRVQSVNEAATSGQAKLRRVVEVFTQELRSAVLGGIVNTPFAVSESEISFLLLDGGAGYQVVPHSATAFTENGNIHIAPAGSLSEAQAAFTGQRVLMVNSAGDAVFMRITSVEARTVGGQARYRLNHAACASRIDFTPNTLLFSVRALGISYDSDTGNIVQQEDAGPVVPFAFDISSMQLEYVYVTDSGEQHILPQPLQSGGLPSRRGQILGRPANLVRVLMTVEVEERAAGGAVVGRSYTGNVELSSNQTFEVNRVVNCVN